MSAELLENNPGLLDDPFGRSDEDVGTLGKDCEAHIAKRIPCVKCEHVVNRTYCGACGVEVERAVEAEEHRCRTGDIFRFQAGRTCGEAEALREVRRLSANDDHPANCGCDYHFTLRVVEEQLFYRRNPGLR